MVTAAAAAMAADARTRLEAIADPAVKAGAERYFKGAVPFIGVKAPRVREVARALYADYGALEAQAIVDGAFAPLRAPHQDQKQLAERLLIAGRVLHPLTTRDRRSIAIEKMPTRVQAQALAEHRGATR